MITAQAKSRFVVAALSVAAAAMITGIFIFPGRKSDEIATHAPKKPKSLLPTPPLGAERAAPEPNLLIRAVREKQRTLSICLPTDCFSGYRSEYLLTLELRVAPDGRVAEAEILTLLIRKIEASNASVTETQIPTDQIEKTSLGRCILVRAERWRLPGLDGRPETVRVPLVLGGS